MELVDLGHRGRVIGGRSTTYALRVNPREQTEVCDPQRRAYSSEHYRREDWAGVHDCALGEELGSSGYVLDPLQERWNALQSSGILGVVGVVWHLVPLLLIHRSPTPGALPDQYNGRLRAAARSAADAGQP